MKRDPRPSPDVMFFHPESLLADYLEGLDRDRFRANMDAHFNRYMRDWDRVARPETIRRAVWGGRDSTSA